MKKTFLRLAQGSVLAAMTLLAMPAMNAQDKIEWGDFKIFIDPGHSGTENRGLWGYSEAEKVLAVALNVKNYLETHTTAVDQENIMLCRYDVNTTVSLEERSDMANAWGADFYYSIHSDASGSVNTTVTLFGGWRKDGVEIEKTPNGGKAFGEILNPNLSGVMRVDTRGNWYDRCFYDRTPETHTNQYPYLSVNRRTNMASILSEGGYHDMAVQQQRNLNEDYKKLEAFAAFQTILTYRGIACPEMYFATGMITNAENDQPINGAVITFGDKTYTTDTYASLFNKYSRNENLIHNGFYFFDGLTAGETYHVTVSAEGFETVEKDITVQPADLTNGPAGSPAYITFFDAAIVNKMPAKVDAISLDNLEDVSPLNPLQITFSRNMDRESVEQAFSIDRNAEAALSWKNDYTLCVDLSTLTPWWTYTIKIDGSVAKNSQTQQFLDGDGDGVEGGDYILKFTMGEPDTEAPYVVSTYPADGSEALYVKRPAIRLEFNEELAFNGDQHADVVTVKDALGKTYTGTLSHEIINGKSVLHFYTDEDLASDCAVLVAYAGGIADLTGNVSDAYAFRFLTEYRAQTSITTIQPLVNTDGMWQPGGSGSTSGIINDESYVFTMSVGPAVDNKTSFGIHYVFDEYASTSNYLIRDHYPAGMAGEYRTRTDGFYDGVLTMWVYGDGSNNSVNLFLRSQPDGIKMRDPYMPVDFRGWNLFVFNLASDGVANFTGSNPTFEGDTKWCLDAVVVKHEYTDPEDEEIPFQEWIGDLGFNGLNFTTWDDQAERTARIDDIELPNDAIQSVTTDVKAPVEYYNLQGIRVANPTNGIFIRRQGDNVQKVLIK